MNLKSLLIGGLLPPCLLLLGPWSWPLPKIELPFYRMTALTRHLVTTFGANRE